MAIVQLTFSEDFLQGLKKLLQDDKNDLKHENYKASIEHCEVMSWHVYGNKPEKLLKRARPREDPEITQYRLDSYEPLTKSVCKKAISIVHKIFNPKLYSIRFEDSDEARRLENYSLQEYPRFNSIVNYMANYVLKKMIADPNGILLVQPFKYFMKGTEYVSPIATCYNSKNIHWWTPEYILLYDGYKEYGQTKEWKYTYCDRNGIYKLEIHQNNGKDITVETVESYVHNFNEIPIWQLQGEYSEDQYGLLESFFYCAVPFWNEAINDHSDVSGNYRMHINSQKWEISDECEYVERTDEGNFACDGGYIFNQIKGDKHKCSSCSGTGRKKSANSPYEVYQVDRQKAFDQPEQIPLPPFGYVAPPVEGLKMLEEKAEKNLEKGLFALNMDVVTKIGENQSGIAKEHDRTELNNFLQRISDVFFEIHFPNFYYFATKYMFSVSSPEKIDKIQPEISKPTQFDVYSTLELTKQFAEAKTANLNPSYLGVKQAEIQNKEFSTKPQLLAILNLELILDPLAEISRDDVSMMLANRTITKSTAIIHDNIKMFVRRAIEENKGFPDMPQAKQVEILKEYADEVEEENKVEIDMSAFETPPNGNPPVNE